MAKITPGAASQQSPGADLYRAVQTKDVSQLDSVLSALTLRGVRLTDKAALTPGRGTTCLLEAVSAGAPLDFVSRLIQTGGADLVTWTYDSPAYHNLTALHLAIVNKDRALVKLLLDSAGGGAAKKGLLHQCASGDLVADAQNVDLTPLTLAVVNGEFGIVDLLLTEGADPLHKDPITGNTTIHNLALFGHVNPGLAVECFNKVISGPEMENWWKKNSENHPERTMAEVLLKTENVDGFTPVVYATYLGVAGMAAAILAVEGVYAFPAWPGAPERYTRYDYTEIDPAVPRTKPKQQYVLDLYVYGLSLENAEFMKIPAIRTAIDNKWRSYYPYCWVWAFFHLAMMFVFSVAIELFETQELIQADTQPSCFRDVILKDTTALILELIFLFYVAVLSVDEVVDIVQSFRSAWLSYRSIRRRNLHVTFHYKIVPLRTLTKYDIYRVATCLMCVCTAVGFVLRVNCVVWQDLFYAFTAVFGWGLCVQFCRLVNYTGVFVVMIEEMLYRDIIPFVIPYMFFLISGSVGIYYLSKADPNPPIAVVDIITSVYNFFGFSVGFLDFEITTADRVTKIVEVFMVGYAMVLNILLLNTIIAAFGGTYGRINSIKKIQVAKEACKMTLKIERMLPKCLRRRGQLTQHGNRWFMLDKDQLTLHPTEWSNCLYGPSVHDSTPAKCNT